MINLLSISGGKDSTAMLLLAYEREIDARLVFADTGHEHPLTYGYVQYLNDWCKKNWGRQIQVVKADFTRQLAVRRSNIQKKWEGEVAQERIDVALANLQPTGNPFLDLCKLKGRFPSTRARFCTQELKHVPIQQQVVEPLLKKNDCLISWQGVRAEESPSRAKLPEKDVEFGHWDPEPKGLLIYRPLIKWRHDQVFEQHRKHGVEWNPLYEHGMSRVGCFPCIMCRKSEIQKMSIRFPEQIDRVADWEKQVGLTAKRGESSFFSTDKTPDGRDKLANGENPSIGIRQVAEWAKTGRGGKQIDLLNWIEEQEEMPSCSSVYGLCE